MDLDSFLVSLYVLTENWWKATHVPAEARVGRPSLISDPEILTLAFPQPNNGRASAARGPFTDSPRRICASISPRSQSQFNRRARALEAEAKALSLHLGRTLAEEGAVYHVLDTTLIPAVVRVRACRRGLFAGQATFGRSASKTEWVYGLKVDLSVTPEGVITAFCLAEASAEERPIGETLIHSDRHAAYLADKGFTSVGWERHWLSEYGALVAATPKDNSKRGWDAAGRLWAAGKRQIVEGIIDQLKDLFFLERHRAKTLEGLLARQAAKICAYTCGQSLNAQLGRPLRRLADLLV
jgi:Transposase DDE domain